MSRRKKGGKLRKLTADERAKKLARDVRRDREGTLRRKDFEFGEKRIPGAR